jgi:hypothetical protein
MNHLEIGGELRCGVVGYSPCPWWVIQIGWKLAERAIYMDKERIANILAVGVVSFEASPGVERVEDRLWLGAICVVGLIWLVGMIASWRLPGSVPDKPAPAAKGERVLRPRTPDDCGLCRAI